MEALQIGPSTKGQWECCPDVSGEDRNLRDLGEEKGDLRGGNWIPDDQGELGVRRGYLARLSVEASKYRKVAGAR